MALKEKQLKAKLAASDKDTKQSSTISLASMADKYIELDGWNGDQEEMDDAIYQMKELKKGVTDIESQRDIAFMIFYFFIAFIIATMCLIYVFFQKTKHLEQNVAA